VVQDAISFDAGASADCLAVRGRSSGSNSLRRAEQYLLSPALSDRSTISHRAASPGWISGVGSTRGLTIPHQESRSSRIEVRYPEMCIVFAESRRFAEEWTFRFLSAALSDADPPTCWERSPAAIRLSDPYRWLKRVRQTRALYVAARSCDPMGPTDRSALVRMPGSRQSAVALGDEALGACGAVPRRT
jgi:hypothetical protein